MPEFVYVLIKSNCYGDEVLDVFRSMEKACETADFMNREEGSKHIVFEVLQHQVK